ncbi:MAG: hypothetical protein HZB41_06765 [Ignavibacteriae bacterium]|nr:hypothetical protein [Ignavibacteriota bacterium]
MKILFVCLFALLFITTSAFSQDENKIGVGASYGMNLVLSDGAVPMINMSMIYVPINMSGFRIEPFLMLFTSSRSYQFEGQSNKSESSYTGLTIGSGFFYLMKSNKSTTPYLGLRVGYGSNSSKTPGQFSITESSQGLLFLGGVLGGEYYFSPNFSLGADVGISYYNFFTPTDKSGQTEVKYSSYSNSQISTTAQIIARIFF